MLRVLDLRKNGIESTGLEALARSLPPSLAELQLDDNELRGTDAWLLGEMLGALKVLSHGGPRFAPVWTATGTGVPVFSP